jgi:hypothetical protein
MKPRRNEEAQAHIGLSSHKKKLKFSLEQAMKAQRGNRGIALFFL